MAGLKPGLDKRHFVALPDLADLADLARIPLRWFPESRPARPAVVEGKQAVPS